MIRKFLQLALVISLTILVAPLSAQESTPGATSGTPVGTVIVSGLNNPRGLYYDSSGVLWISDAGTGGDLTGQAPLGPIQYGGTAQVWKLMPGKNQPTPVLGGLPSAPDFDDLIGVNSVYADANGLWIVTGLGPSADPLDEAVIQLDPKTFRIKQFIDLANFETANNPDKDVIMSDPVDVAVAKDGTLYIADASGNDLLTWTAKDGLKPFHVWLDLAVPTSVDIGPDGNIYVGFLSPYPYDPNTARIEELSPQGDLIKTYNDLTAVTDVLVDPSGTLYAVQFADGYGDLGWNPNSGSVVRVSDAGIVSVAQGLNLPYRMALAPDGSLAVTINSAFATAPNSGEIISLSPAILATSTPEATP